MQEMIFGGPSILEALKNSERNHIELIATEEGLATFKKKYKADSDLLKKTKVTLLSAHKLQEKGKSILEESGGSYQRVPSNIFLLTSLFY